MTLSAISTLSTRAVHRPVVRLGLAFALASLTAIVIGTIFSGSAADADPPPGTLTVDADCTPGAFDCATKINNTLIQNATRPLVVTFGLGDAPGSTYRFSSSITPGPDVYIEGVNQPIMELDVNRVFQLTGTANNSFSDFSIDLQNCAGVAEVFYAADNSVFSNVELSNLNVYNGSSYDNTNTGCQFFNSGADGATGLTIDNVTADKVRRFVRFRVGSDHRNVTLTNNVVTELGHSALNVDGYAEDMLIENNSFLEHAPTAKSGHMIGFQPTTSSSPSIKARNIEIRGNRLQGRPDTAHLKVNGQTQPTGGAADLLAIRGIDGFMVEDNIIMHSGEVGLTATAGLTNGVIRNNIVGFTDTAGIVIGNTSAGNLPVSNVEIYGNDLFHNGLDRLNQYRSRGWAMPTISVWNAYSICVANNDIHDNSVGLGLWVYDGDLVESNWPASVFDLYVEGNTFENNLFDFVNSDHPSGTSSTNGYQPAAQTGGLTWTSTWPGTDSDSDGIATHCNSESNDSDPCVPDATAPACGQPFQDADNDGVVDALDTCPLTAGGPASNIRGCTDDDGDAFYPDTAIGDPRFDSNDADPCNPDPSGTPTGDCDNDGVTNIYDACEGSAPGATVGANGCVGGAGEPPDPEEEEDVDADGFTNQEPNIDPDDFDSCIPIDTGTECSPGPNAANEIVIRARGETGVERMKMALNSSWKLTANNMPKAYTNFTYAVTSPTTVNEVRVNFMNKGQYQGEIKKLHVDWIEIGGVRYEAESPGTYMNGSIAGNNTCFAPGYHENDTLRCNGYFKFYPPSGTEIGNGGGGGTTTTTTTSSSSTSSTSSTTSSTTTTTAAPGTATITIHARGVTGVERMKLALDGSYVATYPNVPTTFTDYVYTLPTPLTVSEVRVNFTNKGKYQGNIKMLDVDYVEVFDGVNTVRYESEAIETWAVGSVPNESNTCMTAGNNENDTLRCNGSFRYYLP